MSIINTLIPTGGHKPGSLVGDEVLYLRNKSDWVVTPEGKPKFYMRTLVAKGDDWPEWWEHAEQSFVVGPRDITVAVSEQCEFALVYGLQLLDGGIIQPGPSLAAISCDCCVVEAFGLRARGDGVNLQVPKVNYGLDFLDCRGSCTNSELGGFSIAVNLTGGVMSVQNNTWIKELPSGIDICAGHGSPGRYEIGDTYDGLTVLGATGYKPQDVWINGIKMRAAG